MHEPPPKLSVDPSELEAVVERALASRRGKVSSFTREAMRENFRTQREYPGQFVAYIDRWRKRGRKRSLKRTVLAAAATMIDINERVDALSPAQQRKVHVGFFHDPNGPLPGRW